MSEQFETVKSFLSTQIFNNTIQDYLTSVVVMVGLVLLFSILKQILLGRFKVFTKKTQDKWNGLLLSIPRRFGGPAFIVAAIYISTLSLELEETLSSIIRYSFVIVVTASALRLLQDFSGFGIERAYHRARPNDIGAETAIRNLRTVVSWGLWILGAIFILDNLGINVSAVVAGLGIGGIAVAMASQAILGDAFSAISIFVDKPFQIGDFIVVGDLMGTVEHIGIKTTRIRSLHGEQLIFSNSDLTASRVRNFKRMSERRAAFEFGVTYETPNELVRKIPELVRSILKNLDGVRLDRAHFKNFGDFALIYEVVYYVLSPDYNTYMDKQQAINFSLKETFEREGIEFAYPTQKEIVVSGLSYKTP